MSLGDNRYNEGTKKSNWKYEFASLTQLSNIASSVAGGATEATLLMVLSALQNGQEFEQNLVMDLGGAGCPGNCPTYLQVRIFNDVTHTFDPPIYYNASGAVVVPVGPLQLVNPQFVLESMLTQLTAINTDLDVALSTRASEATQLLILAALAPPAAISAFRNTAVTNTAVAVKATAGQVWGWNIINPNATPVYLKVYDTAAAGVTVGVTTVVKTLMIPGMGSVFQEPNVAQLINSTAIAIACTTGLADADAVAPGAAVHVEIKYK